MAIAFDATSTGGYDGTGATNTFSHTCSGSDRILFVGFFHGGGDTVTGVTYNSVSMTQVSKVQVPGDRWIYLYYLVNPASGTNNVVCSASGGGDWGTQAISYTGVDQTSPIDAFATNTSTGATTLATSVTTTKETWMVGFFRTTDADSALLTISPGVFRRNGGAGNGYTVSGDSNGGVPAGSNSLTVTNNSPPGNIGAIVAAFSAVGTVTSVNSAFFMFFQ